MQKVTEVSRSLGLSCMHRGSSSSPVFYTICAQFSLNRRAACGAGSAREDLRIFNSVLSMPPTIRCHHCMARGGYGQANRVLYTCKLSVASGKFAFALGTWE